MAKKKKHRQSPEGLELFSVWVGGGEVNDHYLTATEMIELVQKYASEGYEDIAVEQVLNG